MLICFRDVIEKMGPRSESSMPSEGRNPELMLKIKYMSLPFATSNMFTANRDQRCSSLSVNIQVTTADGIMTTEKRS